MWHKGTTQVEGNFLLDCGKTWDVVRGQNVTPQIWLINVIELFGTLFN